MWHHDTLTGEKEPYPVKCARCGADGLSDDFIIEEGDEWECRPCWERCEALERASGSADGAK